MGSEGTVTPPSTKSYLARRLGLDAFCYWRSLIIVLTPILLLPIPLAWRTSPATISICAYVVVLMAVYWVTEAVPITVTALIPLFAFPILGILPAKTVALSYLPDISILFIGGLIVAVAVEEVNLHRRIALLILLGMGSQPRWLMLGIMIATALLSMFISNTATTAMMTPIVLTLAKEIVATNRRTSSVERDVEHGNVANSARIYPEAPHPPTGIEMASEQTNSECKDADPIELSVEQLKPDELRLLKALLLATCYSASIGGTATLTGTGPNLLMPQLLTKNYPDHPINYATWLGYNGPGMVINLIVAWVWLQLAVLGPRQFFKCRQPENQQIRSLIRRELAKLGRPKWSEISVTIIFILLFLLWLTRKPSWGKLFKFGKEKQFVSDGTSAMLMAFLLFVWPLECPDFLCCPRRDKTTSPKLCRSILTWDIVEKRFPWGIVLLLGGGFALGGGVSSSGLSKTLGESLANLDVTKLQLCVISLILMTYMTEFTSNTATASILLPIIMTVARAKCINPLYLTLPVTEAASFAFMLPVATPPNAIVFRAGVLRVRDMIWVGVVMNTLTLCMCEVLLSIHTWGYAMFDLGVWPEWAGNNTDCAVQIIP